MSSYVLEHAYLDGEVRSEVAVTLEDGRFTRVGGPAAAGAERLAGLTLPGFANAHSHAFHRALRGRTQRGRGTFWTWREQMYDLAGRLDPDSYRELATAVFREMAAAGITTVGEFHYLHHRPDGGAYDDPNAMGLALVEAASEAGVRIALLDTLYLGAGIGKPAEGVQVRFSDGTAEAWQERTDELTTDVSGDSVVGAAVHSVRAVPLDGMRLVAEWADRFETPLHVHLSEQVAENEECLAAYGRTPTEVLAEAGVLTDRTTAVHATHLTDLDVARLGAAGCYAGFCPTTERDLGDGIGPSRALLAAGARLTLGSDSHAVIDPFEEMRALEMDERLAERSRGHWRATEILEAATERGHTSLGFADAGRIAVGWRADLVTVDLATSRTAGCGAAPETAVFAATAADVVQVVSGGRVVHKAGDPVGPALDRVVRNLWEDR
jgi:formiminoglutamate deiminase